MLKRLVSLFLGLLILDTLLPSYLSLPMIQMAIFSFMYMFIFNFVELFFLSWLLRYVRTKPTGNRLLLIDMIHLFLEWSIIVVVSLILKKYIHITALGALILLALMKIFYYISLRFDYKLNTK